MLSMLRRHVPAGYQILFLVPGPLESPALCSTKSESGGHGNVLVLRMLSCSLDGDKAGCLNSSLCRMLSPGGGQRLRCILLWMQTVLPCYMWNGN
jgi:hypothetical protein